MKNPCYFDRSGLSNLKVHNAKDKKAVHQNQARKSVLGATISTWISPTREIRKQKSVSQHSSSSAHPLYAKTA